MKHLLRRAAVATVAASCALTLAGPAAADGQKDLADRYGSLSGALLQYYAGQSNQSLESYLSAQQILLAPTTVPTMDGMREAQAGEQPQPEPTDAGQAPWGDADAPGPGETTPGDGTAPAPQAQAPAASGSPGAAAKPLTASSIEQLNATLSQAGLTLDTTGYSSMEDLTKQVLAKSSTPDGAVTLAGAQWAAALGNLHAPALAAPSAATPQVPSVPADALAFGLLVNKSLTRMVTDSPDLFAEASKSGLGTPALRQAWNNSMNAAYLDTRADFSKVLPDACVGGMLAVMASGDTRSARKMTGGNACGSCASAGLYLNRQTMQLFDPQVTSPRPNATGHDISAARFTNMPFWLQTATMEQNPQFREQLRANAANQSAVGTCRAAGSATRAAVGSVATGIFSQLRVR